MKRKQPPDSAATGGIAPWRARTVVLIDNHPVVALGMRFAFQETQRFMLASVAASPAEARSAIERLQPDIVISDLVYGAIVEIGLIRECRRMLPSATLLVFSSLPSEIYERDALKAGADRFVPKAQPVEALIAVLEECAARTVARTPAEPLAHEDAPLTGSLSGRSYLTRREVEIGRRLSVGLSVARIGQDLGLSANTVAVHRDNIRKKLNCRDSAELITRLARMYPAEISGS